MRLIYQDVDRTAEEAKFKYLILLEKELIKIDFKQAQWSNKVGFLQIYGSKLQFLKA